MGGGLIRGGAGQGEGLWADQRVGGPSGVELASGRGYRKLAGQPCHYWGRGTIRSGAGQGEGL